MVIPSILKGNNMPKHLAINASRIREWSEKNNIPISEASSRNILKLKDCMDIQLKKDIPILTLNLSTQTEEEISSLKKFFKELSTDEMIHSKKVRVYIIGNWYNIEPELADNIKALMEKTKDYDTYFLCFCVKYDGQEEILAATKLLVKKALLEKISIDELSVDMLKENIPTSYFIPPEMIVETENKYSGLLLWDSKNSVIYFPEKMWLDFERKDFDKAIDYYNKMKKQA